MLEHQIRSAGIIRPAERDYSLGLHHEWPRHLDGWEPRTTGRAADAYLYRNLAWDDPRTAGDPATAKREDEWLELFDKLNTPRLRLGEAIVRFPSAPIYGTHRKHAYHYTLPKRLNFHTIRLLRQPWEENARLLKATRVYVLNNGLNELRDLTFFYRLAALLLHADPAAACIIRPFPGHLTRHPFPDAFAERPLDRYLTDAGDLFRQYLRFMVETQWLLSALVPRGDYRVVTGLDLLSQGPPGPTSRESTDSTALARDVFRSWQRCFRVSARTKREAGAEISLSQVKSSLSVIRSLVGWDPAGSAPADPPSTVDELRPAIHMVGYSLGGFLAQATFFTWPFAISSCTTICSGGPLREVALTAFAHREEWQTVINAVRHELSSSMLEGRIAFDRRFDRRSPRNYPFLCGIDTNHFSCFYRIFFDVFLQEFRGSYRSRVSEYVDRLFFVVGGRDPIVPIESLLEGSPPEGLNILQIANLGHFLEMRRSDWSRGFWLPKVAHTLRDFSERTETLLFQTLRDNWWNEDRTDHIASVRPALDSQPPSSSIPLLAERDTQTGNDALDSKTFQQELSALASFLAGRAKGWLLIPRNDVPIALLGNRRLHRRGTVLHYSEAQIWKYFCGLRAREAVIRTNQRNITVIVPTQLKIWFARRQPVLSPKFEAAAFRIPSPEDLRGIWEAVVAGWRDREALREFSPRNGPVSGGPLANHLIAAARERFEGLPDDLPVLNTLPDAWIGFSYKALRGLAGSNTDRRGFETNLLRRAMALLLTSDAALRRKWQSWATEHNLQIDKYCKEWDSWVKSDAVRIVKVSAAEFNPRFLGWRIRRTDQAREYLIHAALAYAYSRPLQSRRPRPAPTP